MYKLLIVDDEELDRQLVRLMLADHNQFEIVGEAEDGLAAISLSQRLEPDIILMDIRMPDKNGLDAAKEIKSFLAKVKIIMLTAYDDFQYAKEAIAGKASAYLLKPIDEDELLETLSHVVHELEEEKKQKQRLTQLKTELDTNMSAIRTRFFNDILEGFWRDEGSYEHLDERMNLLGLGEIPDTVLVFKVDGIQKQGEKNSYSFFEIYRHEILNLLCSSLESFSPNSLLFSDSFGSSYIIFALPLNETTQKQDLLQLLTKLSAKVEEEYSISLKIGIGGRCQDLFELAKSYEEAMIALSSINPDEGRISCFNDTGEQDKVTSYPKYLENQLLLSIQAGNLEAATKLVGNLLSFFVDKVELEKGKHLVSAILQKASRVITASDAAEVNILEDQSELAKQLVAFTNWAQLSFWLRKQIQKLLEVVVLARGARKYKIVEKAQKYLEENYAEDLGLERVAKHLDISPCYFSSIFKEVTNVSFSDYLMEVRMGKAKELLADPQFTISEVSYKVGFNDPAYFSRVFKREVGRSPTFYRACCGEKF
jgi:two-component system response regulator YesN